MSRVQLLVGVSFLLVGCVLEPVPFENLTCPCAEPYVCDPVNDRCVARVATVCGRSGVEAGPIEVEDFRVEWLTPEHAHVQWKALDAQATVSEFNIDVARSVADMLAGDFWTIDGDENPELGRAFLLRTSGMEPVRSTTVRELEADEPYAVRLVVIDRGGRVSCTGSVPFRTNLAPSNRVALFDEALPDGARLHRECTSVVAAADAAAEGETSIEHTFRCEQVQGAADTISVCGMPDPIADQCWENVGFVGGSNDMSTLSGANFQAAFIEALVAVDDVSDAFWSEVGLHVGADLYGMGSFALVADGRYHRYQFPLSRLERRCHGAGPECTWGGELDNETLRNGIRGFRVGTTLSHGATLRLDSVAVRW